MSVRKNVFPSKSEQENYYKLGRVWGNDYRIFSNLPFLNVFDIEDLTFSLTRSEVDWLKKTSIDYILCDKQDRPIIGIEFDGLQEGYNIGTKYHQDIFPIQNPWREKILELKLKVAHSSLFPYFVVGSKYFNDITSRVKLTIVDGIIGTIVSNKAVQARFAQGFDPLELGYSQEAFDDLPRWEKSELIQDWIIGIEVEGEMDNNPLSREAAKLYRINNVKSWSHEYLSSPGIDAAKTFEERIKLLEKSTRKGCRFTVHTEDCGDVITEAWLPELGIVGYYGWGLCESIAAILVLDKLERLRAIKN